MLAAAPSSGAPPGREGAPQGTAPVDRGILPRIGLRSDYSTSYTVNRTSRQWDQSFQMSRDIGPYSFSNNWGLNQRRDEAQANLRAKRGLMGIKANYGLGPGKLWTVGFTGTFKRDSQLSTRNDQIENRSDLALAISSSIPERAMHRVEFLRPFALNVAANAGYGADRNVSRRSARRDSTWVNSLIQHYEVGMSGEVYGFSMNGNLNSDIRSGNSETRQRDSNGALVADLNDDSDSRSRHLTADLQWKPLASLSATANTRWISEVNQYWDIQANNQLGGAETKDGRDVGLDATIEWKPSEDLKVLGTLGRGSTQADYDLQNKGFRKGTDVAKVDGTYRFPSLVGPLGGTELQAAYGQDEARNNLEDGVDYRQTNRRLRVGLSRKLGRKLQLVASEEMSLLRYFYQDGSNDRDERRSVADGVLNYYPSGRFSGYFNVNLGQRKVFNIPGTRSSNNSTNQSYRISTQLAYSRGVMRIEQQYTVQADYIYYQFQKSNDALVRTNSVLTTFSHTLGKRINAGLQHEYQFMESGLYVTGQRGTRAYTPQRAETRQQLALAAGYPFGMLRVDARTMYEIRRSSDVRSSSTVSRTRETRRGEFSLRANLEHNFSNTFNLRGSFQKTLSMTERDYWTVRASLDKGF